jgi:hypothetical protein
MVFSVDRNCYATKEHSTVITTHAVLLYPHVKLHLKCDDEIWSHSKKSGVGGFVGNDRDAHFCDCDMGKSERIECRYSDKMVRCGEKLPIEGRMDERRRGASCDKKDNSDSTILSLMSMVLLRATNRVFALMSFI